MRQFLRFPLGGLLLAGPVLAFQAAVPVEQEPRHHVVFENAHIRVIDVSLPPGDVTDYHVHARDNVPIVIGGGAQQVQPLGGSPTETQVRTGVLSFQVGGYTHRVANGGATTLRYIDAELLGLRSQDPTAVPPLAGARGRRLELDNDRVRVYRIRLASGQSLPAHVHALARLDVTVAGGTLTSGLADLRERIDTSPGAFAWYPAGAVHAVANAGRSPIELIVIELK